MKRFLRFSIAALTMLAVLSFPARAYAQGISSQWWKATSLSAGKCLLEGEVAKLKATNYHLLIKEGGSAGKATLYLYDQGTRAFLAAFPASVAPDGTISSTKTFKDKRKVMGMNFRIRYTVSLTFSPSGDSGTLKAVIRTKSLGVNLADITASSVRTSAPAGYAAGSESAVSTSADTFFINTPDSLRTSAAAQ